MAEPQQPHTQMDDDDKTLKYLEFVEVAAIYILACFSSIYEYAKDNSGPLKPGVQTVQETVKTVISPLYEKFHDVPFEFLKFADRKVEDSLAELESHVPFLVKQASSQVRAVATEFQRTGIVDIAKDMYTKYEPVVEHYVVSAWRTLNKLPLFHQAAQIAVPTAAYCSDKYNNMIYDAADRGYPAVAHLPFIPVQRIAKLFNEDINGESVAKK
ncbi:stress-related protein isoform X2 [Euphorbia lathyris]|uniref:stress-related protein isoform X2 n=1 Tax=Euphorbia lathyris TaxID=212925 RepID=UPI003313443F